MNQIIELPHSKYRRAIYSKPGPVIKSASTSHNNQIEILKVEVGNCTVTSVYKPPNAEFTFEKPINFENCDTKIVLGDFNSPNITWEYLENVETWAEAEGLSLIHDFGHDKKTDLRCIDRIKNFQDDVY